MDTFDYEFQLKHTQESLEFALQSGRMGAWDINLETRKITCSLEMLELWNVSPETFTGERSSLQKKVHPDDLERMNAAIDNAIENHTIYELEYRILPSPGVEKWVTSRGRCTFHAESKLPVRFSGVVYDITERKLKEAALDAAVKSRDQFFTIASHELRTPLTSLQLQVQVAEWELQNMYPEAFTLEKLEQNLKKQKDQILRISRIVDNILDESKINQGKLPLLYENFDLCEMISDVLGRFKSMADAHDVNIHFEATSGIEGEWDRFRLEQVLLNLLINAIRYGNKKPIKIDISNDETHVQFHVSDQGIGIKSEDQVRIFERFERAVSSNEISGLGLGLFISKNIVSEHGGEIRIASEIDKGSTFSVVLPRKRLSYA